MRRAHEDRHVRGAGQSTLLRAVSKARPTCDYSGVMS